MNLLRAATVTVSDLSRSVALYSEFLDYRVVEDGQLPESLGASWETPASVGRPYAVLQPASAKDSYIRLVEQPSVPGFKALRTYGWNAIEICVTDVMAVYERLKASPFEIIGPPRENPGLANIHPMQIKGPDEEVIFLTQINDDVPPFTLARATTLIDQMFILVIGCRDMNGAVDWFKENVGLAHGQDLEIAYTMIAKAYGKDLSTQYKLTTMVHESDVFLEVDQYPDEAVDRPCHKDMLPAGFALATFWVPDIDQLATSWIRPPEVQPGVIYNGRRSGTKRGPDGALIEIVEA